jgi:hypothetical protein
MKEAAAFCSCIKKVKKTVKLRSGSHTDKNKEKAAIGICVKSVLHSRGRTLKKFSCRKGPKISTKSLTRE